MIQPLKYWMKILFTICLLVDFLHAIEIANLSQAVDVAGKQRMYTQRMLKDYAMIGLQNNFGSPKEDLEKTMANFENHLDALIAFNNEPKTEESLLKVKKCGFLSRQH